MLPESMELQTPQTKEWPLIPEDVYQTEITNIEYKVEPNRYKQKETDPDEVQRMNFEFTIIEEGPHYGRKVWQKMAPIKPYPPYGKGKSTWVYRLASAMEGHPITKEEADGFNSSNINGYIHRQVRVTVKHSVPNAQGKQYSNVESFLTIKQELPLFDENKVPKENRPVAKTSLGAVKPLTGYDKAKAVADALPVAKQPLEDELPTIYQDDPTNGELNLMVNDDPPMDVEDIPF
jgi:hypothetical protein